MKNQDCHEKQTAIPAHVLESLRALIDYVYDDERRSFEATNEPEDHIFEDILMIEAWLTKRG